ncbi:MAG TPA: LptF/LptG family permease [Cyclobacteriaceae bacterium]|nr:LptF/LptG family permease [Cyclobacteriaceae bacterium]
MKKLDKLILSSFIGPFILTFLVVVFILLTQHMLKYFDDIIGKGLGIDVIGQLLFYFAIFMTPIAMPLAVLLSSLIAFGNLGEHFELTAVKSAGISLVRALLPIFIFVLGLTVVAFYVNNNLVPNAALEAYSLLYDIKQKKPALDLREGTFYDGIPDMSIKVSKKYPDGVTIKDIIIYDHRKHDGNKDVTKADSGKMYTILNERYLKLELYNGYKYTEGTSSNEELAGNAKRPRSETLSRTKFGKTQVVFDLSSFALERTDKKWFQGNRIMRNLSQLQTDMDSIDRDVMQTKLTFYTESKNYFSYHGVEDSLIYPREILQFKVKRDSLQVIADRAADTTIVNAPESAAPGVTDFQSMPRTVSAVSPKKKITVVLDSVKLRAIDSVLALAANRTNYDDAAGKARTAKSQLENNSVTLDQYDKDRTIFLIQWHKILASSLACIAMFLIGAPLGAIIKKGGLGVPFLVSILFFIVYYLLTMTGEKWAKQDIITVPVGVWAGDVILFVIGLLFLRQARLDARFFEADFYMVLWDKAKKSALLKKILPAPAP